MGGASPPSPRLFVCEISGFFSRSSKRAMPSKRPRHSSPSKKLRRTNHIQQDDNYERRLPSSFRHSPTSQDQNGNTPSFVGDKVPRRIRGSSAQSPRRCNIPFPQAFSRVSQRRRRAKPLNEGRRLAGTDVPPSSQRSWGRLPSCPP